MKVGDLQVNRSGKIHGEIAIPGDKSISHRAIIFTSIANGTTNITHILLSHDVIATINIMRALGVDITVDEKNNTACVTGVGLYGLKPPKHPLDCGNSGTTMRLLTGLLCAQSFNSVLIGDASLMKRPMLRVAEPLRLMGAGIHLSPNNTAPIEIAGSGELGVGRKRLKAIRYESPVASAQVKSAILLAGLYAEGKTEVYEKIPTRDHTERMFKHFFSHPHPHSHLSIPGDISSAAFFIVAASITPESDLIIRQVGVNPYRTGLLVILKLMGARITLFNETFLGSEPVADIRVQYAPLHGITIPADLIAHAIDEFPVLFIAAVTAKGKTILRNAKELRVKESDRIATMVNGLRALGISVEEYDDGVCIEGPQVFQGGSVDACGDHRVAMSFAIAGHIAKDSVIIRDCENIATSFPNFVMCCQLVTTRAC